MWCIYVFILKLKWAFWLNALFFFYRKSFFSGHASFSMYTMLYLAVSTCTVWCSYSVIVLLKSRSFMTVMSTMKQGPSIAPHPPLCDSEMWVTLIFLVHPRMDTLHLFLFVQLYRLPFSLKFSFISLSFLMLYFYSLFEWVTLFFWY